jgi:hypothetical protein
MINCKIQQNQYSVTRPPEHEDATRRHRCQAHHGVIKRESSGGWPRIPQASAAMHRTLNIADFQAAGKTAPCRSFEIKHFISGTKIDLQQRRCCIDLIVKISIITIKTRRM